MNDLIRVIGILLQVMVFAILARALLSWFPMAPGNPVANILFQITEPVLAPFRRIIPRVGMFDLSLMVAIIVLQVVSQVLLASAG